MVVYTERNDKRNVKYYTSLLHRLNCHSISISLWVLLSLSVIICKCFESFSLCRQIWICKFPWRYFNHKVIWIFLLYFAFILLIFVNVLFLWQRNGSVCETDAIALALPGAHLSLVASLWPAAEGCRRALWVCGAGKWAWPLLFWLPLRLLPCSWLATFRINWQLLQPAVSVVGVEDCDANKLPQQNQQQQQQYPQQRQQHHQQRIKSKSIFIEQVREHVERGQQMSWQDVRDEANVIIAAVSREIHMNEFTEIEQQSRS